MSVVELLAFLSKKDIRLWLEDENLRFSAPEGAFTAEIKNQVVSNKPAIIEFLKQSQKTVPSTIKTITRDKPLRTSYGQQRLWLLDQLNPGDVTYNMPMALRIKGAIDPDLLDQVFQNIVDRHEVLRTHFEDKDGEPFQVIAETGFWNLERVDLSQQPVDEKESQIAHWVNEDALTPFDLSCGPLFRGKLITVNAAEAGNPEYVLIACMHHIISDGWSMEVLLKEIMAFYIAKTADTPALLPDLPIQYADYSEWQRAWVESKEQKEHLAYWLKTLDGAPPVLDMPTDKPRVDMQSSRGAVHSFELSPTLAAQIETFADREKLTPYMITLGAWQLLLSRYANTSDVVLGAPVAGRDRGETQELIGFFVNMLMLRLQLDSDLTVNTFYQRVKTMVLDGFSHQDLPIDMLLEEMSLERQPGYSPLAQVGFQLLNINEGDETKALGVGPLDVTDIPSSSKSARMEIVLAVARQGTSYSGSVEYNIGLFNESTIVTMIERYQHLLSELTAVFGEKSKQKTLESIQLFSDEELLQALGADATQSRILSLNSNQQYLYRAYKSDEESDEESDEKSVENSYGITVEFEDDVDVDKMSHAIQLSINQHEILRASLVKTYLKGADAAYFILQNQLAATLHVQSIDGDLERSAKELMHQSINLLTDPLVNYHLLQNETDKKKLVFCYHRILLDEASAFLHVDEVLDFYDRLMAGHETDVSARVGANKEYQLRDKARTDADEVLEFWHETAKSVEPLQFSMPDSTRESSDTSLELQGANEETHSLTIDADLRAGISSYCSRQGINLASFFKSVYGLLVQHYCRSEDDFHIFEFHKNRQGLDESDLGCFYQQIPVIFPAALFDKNSTVAELFANEKKYQADVQNYRALSLDEQRVVLPQAPVAFRYNHYRMNAGKNVQGTRVFPEISVAKIKNAVQLVVEEFSDNLTLALSYDANSFVDLSMLDRMQSIAQQIVTGKANRISDVSYIISQEENSLQLAGPETNAAAANGHANIIEWFESQVEKSANEVAVVFEETQLTYEMLNQKANQLARHLSKNKVEANSRVGICLDRSVDLVVSILAVLKAGGTYVPMDANYPKERLAFIAEDSNAPFVITHSSLSNRLPALAARVFLMDSDWATLADVDNSNLKTAIDENDQIYIIYTSGSTGRPKGAAVTHKGELNLQQWYTHEMQFSNDTKTLLVSAVGFDLTQKNLFAALLQGGTLVIPKMELFDEQLLVDLIQQHQVSVVNCAPSAFYPLVETAAFDGYQALASLKHVVLGGESIQLPLLYPWLTSNACKAQLINSYGPTECTDVVAYHRLEQVASADQIIPIGKPIQNTQLYILNESNQVVVPGCVGELCIAGTGVGLGYLNQDELTAEVFVDNPLGDGLMYRTGDLVRYQPDGNLIYVGRKDFQIKLRGLRIELGEIEWTLQQLADVSDSLVLLKEEELVAYVVLSAEGFEQAKTLLQDQWRDNIRQHLPEYMLPNALVVLPHWPLTPNGKVDRKALPDPSEADSKKSEYIAPRDALETQLVTIWTDVLATPNIGVLDNLFDLGGNSLLATRIISRTNQAFDIEVRVRDLFLSPSVSELARLVRHAQKGGVAKAPEIVPVDKSQPLPISFAQQRLWFLDQLDPGTPAYNMPGAIKLDGVLDVDLLSKVFSEIINRHDSLRTYFTNIDDVPYQVIGPKVDWKIKCHDISNMSAKDRDTEALKQAQEEVSFNFDLQAGPLIRTRLLKLTDLSYVLIVNMHHIISDGWSNGILMQDLVTIYEAFSNGSPSPLADLKIHYADFSVWQREWLQGDVLQEQIDFWKQQLADAKVLELPFDKKRGPKQTFNGAFEKIVLDADLTRRLNQLARSHGATLFQAVLAAFNVLLHKYSGQNDFAVGTPIANRNRTELESIIGFFVNTLALRAHFEEGESFVQQLERVREHALDAYAYQDVPFERLVDELNVPRDMSHSPIFQVMFNLVTAAANDGVQLPGLKISPVGEQFENVKFDLMLDLIEIDGQLQGSLGFNTDLFLPNSAKRLVEHFCSLLAEVVKSPETPLQQLKWLTADESHRQLVDWNQTAVDYAKDKTIHQLFVEQANKTPANVAIQFGDNTQTYQQLDEASNRVARYLVEQGVVVGDKVGLCLDRCPELMSTILGILKAGAVYVPLDASYPHGRIQYIIENAAISLVLTRSDIASELPTGKNSGQWQYLNLDELSESIAACDSSAIALLGSAEQLLYMIYTSGSTGRPKGTGAFHRAEVNLLSWYCREFGMTEQDNVLLMSAIGFDLTQKNFFAPLLTGASLVIPNFQEYDPEELCGLIKEQNISWLNCAPSAFYPLQDEVENWQPIASLKNVFLGGEAINLQRLQKWSNSSSCVIINSYGPTECTDIATWHRLDVERELQSGSVPIGRPNDNVKLYIVDASNHILPIGAIGELCIAGDSVGPGYLNNPGLTHEVFVENPNLPSAEIMYKTGDLVRYRQDGVVEYLGRRDHQIKLRGFRIETDEIQAVINENEQVKESLVAVVDQPNVGQQLIAWVVCADVAKTSETNALEESLIKHLSNLLPGYMMPAAFVLMGDFPLTPNGKIDRSALPVAKIGSVSQAEYIAPTTDIEQGVYEVWAEILGLEINSLEKVGIDDDFFAVGGQSLLATQVVSRLRKRYRVALPLRKLFDRPTIRAIANVIEQEQASGEEHEVQTLAKIARDGELPLSFSQRRLWILDKIEPGSSAYNMPIAFRLKGTLNVDVLQRVFNEIVDRHESFRTYFVDGDGNGAQVIVPELQIEVAIEEMSEDASEPEIKQRAEVEFSTPFSLQEPGLLRAKLLRLSDIDHVLLVTMHHIVSDGWSLSILIREVAQLYQAFVTGGPSTLPPAEFQYADYAAWQNNWMSGDVLDKQLTYWKETLSGSTVLELPTDKVRPPVQSYRGAHHNFVIDETLTEKLNGLGRDQGATLFMTMFAAFNVLLYRYSNQTELLIGTPVANRTLSETEEIIGFFVNTLVLKTELADNPSFSQLLQQVKLNSSAAFDYQDLPFEKILDELNVVRDMSHSPLFQVMFILQNTPKEESVDLSGLVLEPVEWDQTTAKFDLTLSANEIEGKLHCDFEYATDLFEADTIGNMAQHFERLLNSLVDSPESTIDSYPLLSDAEIDQQLVAWNTTAIDYDSETSVQCLFEQQVATTPDRIALTVEGKDISYQALNTMANRLAGYLMAQGVKPGDLIGVCCSRSVDMLVSLLAVLKSGSAYVPIDPEYPKARIKYVIEHAKPSVILTQVALSEVLPETSAAKIICLDTIQQELDQSGPVVAENPTPVGSTSDLAYVIYTSGSTGNPKGVAISQKAFSNFLFGMKRDIGIDKEDILLAVTSLSFDIAGLELFLPLLNGARVLLATKEQSMDVAQLMQLIEQQQVSFLQATPATWHMLVNSGWKIDRPFRGLCGGEPLPIGLANALLDNGVNLTNVYGPTETTVWSSLYHLEQPLGGTVPIGKPIANTQCYVLDRMMRPVPVGVAGELYIGGDGLADGYLYSPELTEGAFVNNPFSSDTNSRIYKTGDLVRYLKNGNLECLGRLDHQVKIRGFRIELGEIETVFNRFDVIKEGVVHPHEDASGVKYLVAYYTVAEESVKNADIRTYLKESLPDYMVPTAFVEMEAMPLTPNGKVDRKSLKPESSIVEVTEYVAPSTEVEQAIADIWESVLAKDKIGINDNFFEIGGHSLLAVQIVSRVKEKYEVEFPLKVLFETTTIAAMANYIETVLWANADTEDDEESDDDMEEFEI